MKFHSLIAHMLVLVSLAFAVSCDKGQPQNNQPPQQVPVKKPLASDPAPNTPQPTADVLQQPLQPAPTADVVLIEPDMVWQEDDAVQLQGNVVPTPTNVGRQPKPGEKGQPGVHPQPDNPSGLQPAPVDPSTGQPGTVPQPNSDDGQGPLAPQVVQAPQGQKCLQWSVVKREVCKPKLECRYVGGTCHQVNRCRTVSFSRTLQRRVCWQRPTSEYITQRVCEPRWITSQTVDCHEQTVMTTINRTVCQNVPVRRNIVKRECSHNPSLCTMQKVCTSKPSQVCTPVQQRRQERECRNVPVRVTKPQRVCGPVQVKKTVMEPQCRNLPGRCTTTSECKMVPVKQCGNVKKTVMTQQCTMQRVPQGPGRQICKMVAVRKMQKQRVCKPGPVCKAQMMCANRALNNFCTSHPTAPQCRACRPLRRCPRSVAKCSEKMVPVVVKERRCTPSRTGFTMKKVCKNVPKVVTQTGCTMVAKRQCAPKKVCTPGRRECVNRPVIKLVTENKCRMVTQQTVVQQQQCRNVMKVVTTKQCRVINKPECHMERKCRPGGERCVNRTVFITSTERRCRVVPVRQPMKRRVCRTVPVRRQLRQCRMERRMVTKMVPHCKDVAQVVPSTRIQCDPGVRCTPGVERCAVRKICRLRYKQVCSAW